jgi:hypothetical protein
MYQRLVAEGMGRIEATRAADAALRPEIEKAKSEGALPGWAEGLLSVAGGFGGWAAGAKIAGKAAAKAVAGEATKDAGKALSAVPAKRGPAGAEEVAKTLDKKAGDAIPKAPQTMEMEPVRKPVRGMRPDDGTDLLESSLPSAFPQKTLTPIAANKSPSLTQDDIDQLAIQLGAFPR